MLAAASQIIEGDFILLPSDLTTETWKFTSLCFTVRGCRRLAHCLRTQRGFEHIVKHIVGMLSIRDEADYGLDVTRSPSQDILSINDRYYQVVRLLYMRQSLRGRSTVVYNLDGTILAYLEHRA